ncbi:MAG: aminoglycoside phosphotransferase family protein, partial [Myxococcota bacterium]
MTSWVTRLRLEGDGPSVVVVKGGVPDTPTKQALYAREVRVYREVRPSLAPKCYHVAEDPKTGATVLVLEAIEGRHPIEGLTAARAAGVGQELRSLHEAPMPLEWPTKDLGDPSHRREALAQGLMALDRYRFPLCEAVAAWVVRTAPQAWDRLQPSAFVHADLHPENLLLDGERVV